MPRNAIPDHPNVTSIRLPDDFKAAVDLFLDTLNKETGIYMSRSEFMTTATYWYLDHLIQANSGTVEDLRERLGRFSRHPNPRSEKLPENSSGSA